MKSPLFIFLFTVSCGYSSAQLMPGAGNAVLRSSSRPEWRESYRDPYRKAAGRYWDLGPLFRAYYAGSIYGLPSDVAQWRILRGKVTQSEINGVLVTYGAPGSTKTIFIRHYPYLLPDGAILEAAALPDGLFSYISIEHAKITVEAFDYGLPYQPDFSKLAASKTNSLAKPEPKSKRLDTNTTQFHITSRIPPQQPIRTP